VRVAPLQLSADTLFPPLPRKPFTAVIHHPAQGACQHDPSGASPGPVAIPSSAHPSLSPASLTAPTLGRRSLGALFHRIFLDACVIQRDIPSIVSSALVLIICGVSVTSETRWLLPRSSALHTSHRAQSPLLPLPASGESLMQTAF